MKTSKADEILKNNLEAVNISISQLNKIYNQLDKEKKISIPYKEFKNIFKLTFDNLDNLKILLTKMMELIERWNLKLELKS